MLAVLHILGQLIALFSAGYLLPVVTALITRDGTVLHFIGAAGTTFALGLALAAVTRPFRRELRPRDGFLLVTLTWVTISLIGALPLITALPDVSFTDAIFESVSGLTTTGSTVLIGLDHLPPAINMWRHTLHWYGGLGIIVLAVAILPVLGVGGMQIYKAETPGPMKDEKLTPRITETAKSLWLAYLMITLIAIAALWLCGMSLFDAICHAFSVVALGGFSTHDQSIGYYGSVAIEMVLVVLMVISALSFARHFIALRRMTLEPYLRDAEGRAILLLLSVSVLGIALLLTLEGTYESFATALRHSAFNVVSVATTMGLVSQNYEQWPTFAPIWMLILCSITCSTGSTGSGIKMFRTLLLSRQAGRELRMLVHPNAVVPVRVGGRPVPARIADSVLAFLFLYFVTIVVLTLAMLVTGVDLVTAFSAIVASVNNTGPGLGQVGPAGTYQPLSDVQTWICTIAMLLGRLEIFSVLVLFTPAFWRK